MRSSSRSWPACRRSATGMRIVFKPFHLVVCSRNNYANWTEENGSPRSAFEILATSKRNQTMHGLLTATLLSSTLLRARQVSWLTMVARAPALQINNKTHLSLSTSTLTAEATCSRLSIGDELPASFASLSSSLPLMHPISTSHQTPLFSVSPSGFSLSLT